MGSKLFEFLNFMEANPKYQPYVRSIRTLYSDCGATNLHLLKQKLKISQ